MRIVLLVLTFQPPMGRRTIPFGRTGCKQLGGGLTSVRHLIMLVLSTELAEKKAPILLRGHRGCSGWCGKEVRRRIQGLDTLENFLYQVVDSALVTCVGLLDKTVGNHHAAGGSLVAEQLAQACQSR